MCAYVYDWKSANACACACVTHGIDSIYLVYYSISILDHRMGKCVFVYNIA